MHKANHTPHPPLSSKGRGEKRGGVNKNWEAISSKYCQRDPAKRGEQGIGPGNSFAYLRFPDQSNMVFVNLLAAGEEFGGNI